MIGDAGTHVQLMVNTAACVACSYTMTHAHMIAIVLLLTPLAGLQAGAHPVAMPQGLPRMLHPLESPMANTGWHFQNSSKALLILLTTHWLAAPPPYMKAWIAGSATQWQWVTKAPRERHAHVAQHALGAEQCSYRVSHLSRRVHSN